ncbi:YkvA family protein [Streptomyces rubrogriseus]|uniref:YkvA family protein n=1 Tax=Streptomyces rubrogriseus TaxID=194673 RepID=UPI0036F8385E
MLYLTTPIDLTPAFLPVIGYADDAIIVAFTLRSVAPSESASTRCAPTGPGPEDGFTALARLTRLPG